MDPSRRAVIDVGTNSIKLLVAEVEGDQVRPLWEESKQTRLGRGFYETHRLQPEPIAATARAVAGFAAAARRWQPASIRVVATSAAREATNGPDLSAAIAQASGLTVEIVSGAQEAAWAFRGATTDARLAADPLLILDVGGGSTQFILGQGQRMDFRHSFPLGTVRLLEKVPHGDPPRAEELAATRRAVSEFLQQKVRPLLEEALRRERERQAGGCQVRLLGTGGTASIIGCMEAGLERFDRERLEATRLGLDRLHWHTERLWALPLAARQQLAGLPRNRADVILTGVVIYEEAMRAFRFPELRISTRGLRFGVVLDNPGDANAR